MKMLTLPLTLVLAGVACSSLNEFQIPPSPLPPSHWSDFSTSSVPGSDCPVIEGVYFEPPVIYRVGVDDDLVPKDNTSIYSSFIPFHRAERREFPANGKEIFSGGFEIRQPDPTQFYFLYFNKLTDMVVEYHFQQSEGDFTCANGQIEFPKITSYGVIEGTTVNHQIKNRLLMDEEGALVIQSTGGPYRGNISHDKRFMFEFFKYLPEGGRLDKPIVH